MGNTGKRMGVGRGRVGACGVALALVVLLVTACDPNVPADPAAIVRASIGSISVTGRTPGTPVELTGPVRRTATADAQGAVVFRDLPAGPGYAVRAEGLERTGLTVETIESSTPSASFYASQRLTAGFQYLTMRDGTTLSAMVYLPPGPGPFPTVVEYSGYDESRPGRNYKDAIIGAGIPLETACALAPYLCTSPFGKGILAAMFDYAVVNVNVRGTGCSGGSFELLTDQFRADGYDVIEAVAAQPWVKDHRVGMVGGSFHGFSQISVASTHPPSLLAITPEVPLKDAIRDLGAPGGMTNTGFARNWTEAVERGAAPYGQGWEQDRVDGGDLVCERNQALHDQRQRLLPRFDTDRYYPDDLAYLDLTAAAASVDVPVFLTASWQDEQVGSAAAGLCDRFVRAPVRRCVFGNGFHGDQNPDMIVEWKAFLDFYVRRERSPIGAVPRLVYPLMMKEISGAAVDLPAQEPFLPDASGGVGAGLDALRRRYEASPGVKVLLDVGDAGADRALSAPASATYAQWPPSGMSIERFALDADGTLTGAGAGPASGGGVGVGRDTAVSFRSSNALAGRLLGDAPAPPGSTTPIRVLTWQRERPGEAVVFVTSPATSDRLLVGPSRADLWIRSSAAGADLAVTISE
ncbi:MAG: CocE/NonD family hydrolase, partial [Actinobacteria bacterium]|nr:CocE/NonD family hydrolase [Actinomycetota bacterium]